MVQWFEGFAVVLLRLLLLLLLVVVVVVVANLLGRRKTKGEGETGTTPKM